MARNPEAKLFGGKSGHTPGYKYFIFSTLYKSGSTLNQKHYLQYLSTLVIIRFYLMIKQFDFKITPKRFLIKKLKANFF